MDDVRGMSFSDLMAMRTHVTGVLKRQSASREMLAAQACLLERLEVEVETRVKSHIARMAGGNDHGKV